MSSPIFDYYIGCDKFLSKEKEGSIDIEHSLNFIEKNKFISSLRNKEKNKTNKLFNNQKDLNELNDLNDFNNEKKNTNIFGNIYNNNFNYNNIINQNYNNNNNVNYIYNNPYENNDYQSVINNINGNINNNINAYYYLNAFSFNDENYPNKKVEKKYKTKKNNLQKTIIRKGDWICKLCNNLNFSFRICCNICHAPK
jgi:hypothetical protein